MYLVLRRKNEAYSSSWCALQDGEIYEAVCALKNDGYVLGRDIIIVPIHDNSWQMCQTMDWHTCTERWTRTEKCPQPQSQETSACEDTHGAVLTGERQKEEDGNGKQEISHINELLADAAGADTRFSYLNRIPAKRTERTAGTDAIQSQGAAKDGKPAATLYAKQGKRPITLDFHAISELSP